jgi:hypothetical protein
MGPCFYGDEIKETRDKVSQIHDALLGELKNPEKPGLMMRVTLLEKSHKFFVRMLWSMSGITMSALLTAVFMWVFGKH